MAAVDRRILQPVRGQITFRFGEEYIPPRPWGKIHNGLDIGVAVGTPGRESAGQVVKVGWEEGGYGNYVRVDHGKGVETLAAHLSQVLVSAGERVDCGQVCWYSGNTGASTGPHVHFEVRVNGVRVDPEPWLTPYCEGEEEPPEEPPVYVPESVAINPTPLKVAAVSLNVRAGPGTRFPILRRMKYGTRLTGRRVAGDGSGGVWFEIGNGEWSAGLYGQDVYLEMAG